MQIKEILEAHGYPIIDGGSYLSTKALFRGGDNPTAICIYPSDNLVIDFPNKERYDIQTLIGKIIGTDKSEKIEEYIRENKIDLNEANGIHEKLIDAPKKISKKWLDQLEPNHQYWLNRGIDIKILEELKGGQHNNRYYFPIWNNRTLVGFTARDLTGKSKAKWLHKGKKTEWIWPSIKPTQQSGEVFLVESPGDALSLMTCGIRQVLCVFGSECSWKIINELLKIPQIQIHIAFNNDKAGEIGSLKTKNKLKKYFDSHTIFIDSPTSNDWNDLLLQENGKDKILSLLNKN